MNSCCPSFFSRLRHLEVINLCDGCRLGYVCDLEIDCTCGRIISLTVPERQSLFCFKKPREYRVPWECIEKISNDVILVKNAYPLFEEP